MKKLFGIFLLTAVSIINYAQNCNGVNAEAFPMSPQSGSHNYFGVRVTLNEAYGQDVTVNGYIYDEGAPNTNNPYSLTIPAGHLSAETDASFYQTDPSIGGASVDISSVSPCPFSLTEFESRAIILSSEFQTLIRFHNRFLDKIDSVVDQGTSLDSIRAAALGAVESGNHQPFYLMLFNSIQSAESFFDSLTISKNNFIEANPFVEEHEEEFTCSTCSTTLTGEINYFFDNFQTFNANRYNPDGESAAEGPVCGSYWNQIKLAACAAACSATTAGFGTAFCGWMCWCTFCTKNSALGTILCQD